MRVVEVFKAVAEFNRDMEEMVAEIVRWRELGAAIERMKASDPTLGGKIQREIDAMRAEAAKQAAPADPADSVATAPIRPPVAPAPVVDGKFDGSAA